MLNFDAVQVDNKVRERAKQAPEMCNSCDTIILPTLRFSIPDTHGSLKLYKRGNHMLSKFIWKFINK
jgi:hypothetical protein